jgi:FMN phosphatase YigB (HAD superfamily)
MYYQLNSGVSRKEGAEAIVQKLTGYKDLDMVLALEDAKNHHYIEMLHDGQIKPYKDTLMFLLEAYQLGVNLAFASSSTNAETVLKNSSVRNLVPEEYLVNHPKIESIDTLWNLFNGIGLYGKQPFRGKPNPDIFLETAKLIDESPENCVVIEDSVAGIKAAKKGGFYCIALNRNRDYKSLLIAGANEIYNYLPQHSYGLISLAVNTKGKKHTRVMKYQDI